MQEDPGGRGAGRQSVAPPARPPARSPSADAARECVAFRVQPGRSMTAIGIIRAMSPPAAPAVEARQVVRAHDPDEIDTRIAPLEKGQRVDRVAGPDLLLETRSRRCGDGRSAARASATRSDSRGEFARILQGIARGDDPPDPVEARGASGPCRLTMAVPRMGGIERAAIEADPHARGAARGKRASPEG